MYFPDNNHSQLASSSSPGDYNYLQHDPGTASYSSPPPPSFSAHNESNAGLYHSSGLDLRIDGGMPAPDGWVLPSCDSVGMMNSLSSGVSPPPVSGDHSLTTPDTSYYSFDPYEDSRPFGTTVPHGVSPDIGTTALSISGPGMINNSDYYDLRRGYYEERSSDDSFLPLVTDMRKHSGNRHPRTSGSQSSVPNHHHRHHHRHHRRHHSLNTTTTTITSPGSASCPLTSRVTTTGGGGGHHDYVPFNDGLVLHVVYDGEGKKVRDEILTGEEYMSVVLLERHGAV